MSVLPLSYLSDRVRFRPFKWDVQRNDELSGAGDGRIWQAELAPPLWTADVAFMPMANSSAEEADAIVRSLGGSRRPFLLSSPLFCAPKGDPDGSILGASSVTVSAIASDRQSITIGGLPVSYKISPGDKGQVSYGNDPERTWFFEFSEDRSGNGTVAVFPAVPLGVSAGAAITLIKPACSVVIVPGSARIGSISGPRTDGGGFRVIQKR